MIMQKAWTSKRSLSFNCTLRYSLKRPRQHNSGQSDSDCWALRLSAPLPNQSRTNSARFLINIFNLVRLIGIEVQSESTSIFVWSGWFFSFLRETWLSNGSLSRNIKSSVKNVMLTVVYHVTSSTSCNRLSAPWQSHVQHITRTDVDSHSF